jgi:hypothetical protein
VIVLQVRRSDVVALKEMGYRQGCRYIEDMHKREMALRIKDLKIIILNSSLL